MATCLVLPYPGHGHQNPLLPVVAALSAAGEEPLVVVPPPFDAQARAVGAAAVALPIGGPAEPPPGLASPYWVIEQGARWSEHALPALLALVEAERPRWLLYDTMAPWGFWLAQITGLPAVGFIPMMVMLPQAIRDVLRPPGPRPSLQPFFHQFHRIAGYYRAARRLARSYQITVPSPFAAINLEQPHNIVCTAPTFQPYAETLYPARYTLIGASVGRRQEPPPFDWAPLAGGPLVYVSLGTIFNTAAPFFRACIAAFAGSRFRVLLSIGRHLDPAALGPLPPNVVAAPFVPQLEVLDRASLFITHAGMNSAVEGLLAGVPMLAAPQMGDQFVVAKALARAGAARILDLRRYDAELIRAQAELLLGDDAASKASRALGDDLRAAGGPARAAQAIQAYLAARATGA